MKWISTYGRPGGLVLLLAAAAVTLAVFGGSRLFARRQPREAHRPPQQRPGRSNGDDRRAHSTATPANDSSTGLLDQWAACERRNGDSNQADPTVEHQVIYIPVQMGALANWNPDDATAPCGRYLAAARSAVAGGQPATHLGAGGSTAPGWGRQRPVRAVRQLHARPRVPNLPLPLREDRTGREREHQLQRHRHRPEQPGVPERERQPDLRQADRRTRLVDQQLGPPRKRRRLPRRHEPQQSPAPTPTGRGPLRLTSPRPAS